MKLEKVLDGRINSTYVSHSHTFQSLVFLIKRLDSGRLTRLFRRVQSGEACVISVEISLHV